MQGSVIINLDGDTFSICTKGNNGLMCLREGKIGDNITNVDEFYDILQAALEGDKNLDEYDSDSPYAEALKRDETINRGIAPRNSTCGYSYSYGIQAN